MFLDVSNNLKSYNYLLEPVQELNKHWFNKGVLLDYNKIPISNIKDVHIAIDYLSATPNLRNQLHLQPYIDGCGVDQCFYDKLRKSIELGKVIYPTESDVTDTCFNHMYLSTRHSFVSDRSTYLTGLKFCIDNLYLEPRVPLEKLSVGLSDLDQHRLIHKLRLADVGHIPVKEYKQPGYMINPLMDIGYSVMINYILNNYDITSKPLYKVMDKVFPSRVGIYLCQVGYSRVHNKGFMINELTEELVTIVENH